MSENKEYISQVQDAGAVHISEDVISAIAATAASEVDGVNSLGANRAADLGEKFGMKSSGKGVRICIGEDDTITVECSIIVKLGICVMDVAKAVQDAIVSAVESVTGIKLSEVNVTVAGVALPKEQKK